MDMIRLHSNGQITQKGRDLSSSVLKVLGHCIALEDEFTLGSFFAMVHLYPELKHLSDMLEPLLDIISKKRHTHIKTPDLTGLIFYKTIEIKGFPGNPALNIYSSLKGVGPDSNLELKFFHIETLLDHSLILGKLKHVVFGDTEDIFQYDTFYTLFELVEGIAWELSFNFNPLQCFIRR